MRKASEMEIDLYRLDTNEVEISIYEVRRAKGILWQ